MSGLTSSALPIAVSIVWIVAIALAGGLLTEVGDWYENLNFPSWRPPNWLFGPAWTVIYLFIGAAGVTAWNAAPDESTRNTLLLLLAINSALNVLWSPLFFKFRRPDWALLEIVPFWLSILALVVYVARFSTLAGALMAPYLAWVTFAAHLNYVMVRLNGPFGAEGPVGRNHGRAGP